MPASKKITASSKKINFKLNISPRLRLVLLSSLAALLLLVANSALWVNRVIFNTENFSQITTDSLLSESSRDAMATEIVDRALQDRPAAKTVVQEPATKFISGLLDTTQAHTVVSKVSSKLQIVLTSEKRENVEIDLTGIKQTATKLIDLAGKEDGQAATKVENIPDSVTLLDTSKFPTFYQLGTLFMWLAPITFIAGVLILAWPHLKAKKLQLDTLLKQGLVVLAAYLLGLLVGPLFRPPILSQFSNSNLRTVAENLYNSFIASFNSQIQLLLLLGLVMVIIPLGSRLYNLAKKKK